MRLLTKQEIDKAKAIDRSREIAEGLKITRKVDSLRELIAKEDEALNKFRKESLEAIMKDISEAGKKKEKVLAELHDLEERAKKEMSKEDKKRLEELKDRLAKQETEISKKNEELDLKEIDIACTIKETKEALQRALVKEGEIERLKNSAMQKESESEQRLIYARKVEENAIKDKESKENELALREHEISEKEKSNAEKEKENIKTRRELDKERVLINDQRETLKRAIERIRQNRI